MERIEYEMPGCLGGKVYLGSYEDQYCANFSDKYENTFNVWCFYWNLDDEKPFYEEDMGTPRWSSPVRTLVVRSLVKFMYGYVITDTRPYTNQYMALWDKVEPSTRRYGKALDSFSLEALFSKEDPVWKIMHDGNDTGFTIRDHYWDKKQYEQLCFEFLYGKEKAAEIIEHLDEPEKHYLYPSFMDGKLCYDLEFQDRILACIPKEQLQERYEYIETQGYVSGQLIPTYIYYHIFRLDDKISFIEELDYDGDIYTTYVKFSTLEECREYISKENLDFVKLSLDKDGKEV